MKRKLLAMLLSMVTVLSVCSMTLVSVCAAEKSVTLTVEDKWVESGTILATASKAKVYNAASSKHRVYGIIQYKSGSDYINDKQFLVGIGDTETSNSSSTFMSSKNWRLQLNPYGVATKGCTATGTIYSR